MVLLAHAARVLAYERTAEERDDLAPMVQEYLKRDVRAVLTALLDATPDVGIPGEKLLGDERGHCVDRADMTAAWGAMIDVILDKGISA